MVTWQTVEAESPCFSYGEYVKRLFEIAKQNTKYNAQGQAVISKDDPWRYETEWDEYNDEDISLDHPRNH